MLIEASLKIFPAPERPLTSRWVLALASAVLKGQAARQTMRGPAPLLKWALVHAVCHANTLTGGLHAGIDFLGHPYDPSLPPAVLGRSLELID
jgi:hypothetical protein